MTPSKGLLRSRIVWIAPALGAKMSIATTVPQGSMRITRSWNGVETGPDGHDFGQPDIEERYGVLFQLHPTSLHRKSRTLIAKWAIGSRSANYPMALDDANKRLFVGCRLPSRLVVLDTDSAKGVEREEAFGTSSGG
jgi:hypothetical protein